MTAANVAIVFGPNLLASPPEHALKHAQLIPELVKTFIEEYARIFEVTTKKFLMPYFLRTKSMKQLPQARASLFLQEHNKFLQVSIK